MFVNNYTSYAYDKGRRIEAAEIEREEVTNTLSKDRFGNIDEFSRSALLKSYNAHAIAANSAARYNFEQDQQCRSSGTHPNEWRINDGDYFDHCILSEYVLLLFLQQRMNVMMKKMILICPPQMKMRTKIFKGRDLRKENLSRKHFLAPFRVF